MYVCIHIYLLFYFFLNLYSESIHSHWDHQFQFSTTGLILICNYFDSGRLSAILNVLTYLINPFVCNSWLHRGTLKGSLSHKNPLNPRRLRRAILRGKGHQSRQDEEHVCAGGRGAVMSSTSTSFVPNSVSKSTCWSSYMEVLLLLGPWHLHQSAPLPLHRSSPLSLSVLGHAGPPFYGNSLLRLLGIWHPRLPHPMNRCPHLIRLRQPVLFHPSEPSAGCLPDPFGGLYTPGQATPSHRTQNLIATIRLPFGVLSPHTKWPLHTFCPPPPAQTCSSSCLDWCPLPLRIVLLSLLGFKGFLWLSDPLTVPLWSQEWWWWW